MKLIGTIILILFTHILKAQNIYPKKDISACLMGYVDDAQKWIIEPKFSEAGKFMDGYAIVRYGDKNAVIDSTGKFILSPDYESIYRTENFNINPIFIVSKTGKYYLFDQNLKPITPHGFGNIRLISFSKYFLYKNTKQDQKWGVLDNNGSILSPEIFSSTVYKYGTDSSKIFQFKENNLWGLYDVNKKKIIINAEYQNFHSIDNKIFYASFMHENRNEGETQEKGFNYNKLDYRLLDNNCDFISNEIYDSVITTRDFHGGYYSFPRSLAFVIIKKDNKYNFWGGGKVNEYKIWFQELPIHLHHGTFLVKKQHKYGIFNLNKKQIVPIKYDKIWPADSYYLCKKKRLWAIFDTNGVNLSGFKYRQMQFNTQTKFIYGITAQGKIVNINTSNGQDTAFNFTKLPLIQLADKEVIKLLLNGKESYFDLQGNKISEGDFFALPDYFADDNSLGVFSNTQGNGLINCQLKIVIPPIYDTIVEGRDTQYDTDVFWVIKNGKWGMLDDKGKEILPPKYEIPVIIGDWIDYNDNCLFEFQSPIIIGIHEDTSILFDTKEGIISPSDVVEIISRNNTSDYFFKSTNEKFGLINEKGQVVIPPISEKYPYISGDTALILVDTQFYCFFTSKQKLINEPLSETEIIKTIMTQYDRGDFGEDMGFSPHCSKEIKEKFLLEVYYNKIYQEPDIKPDPKQVLIRSLPYYYSFDYCNIDYCYRSITEDFNDVDYQCWPPGYGTFEETNYTLTRISKTDFVFETNSMTYGHGSGDISSYEYYSLTDHEIKALHISDLFKTPVLLFDFLSTVAIHSEEIKEMSDQIDCTANSKLITEESDLLIAEDGLHCLIPYWEYGEYQVDIVVPWDKLKQYIPANDKLEKIINYIKAHKVEE